jgi:hypothetical protein
LLPSPTAVAVSEADRMAGLLQRLAELEEIVGLGRECRPAGFLHPALAIDDRVADGGQRQADELAVARRIIARPVIPAAVFLTEVVGEIGDLEQLVGILVGIVEPDEHDVGPGADIGRDLPPSA